MRCLLKSSVVLSCALTLLVADARSQTTRKNDSEEAELITEVYRVTDMVLPTPDYSFQGIQLPGSGTGGAKLFGGMGGMGGGGMGGGMMGGMGGGTGGMGGGFFNVPNQTLHQMDGGGGGGFGGGAGGGLKSGNGLQITMDDLIETLTATIEPETWDEVGGRGSIGTLGGLLVIQQTPAVHLKIRSLLAALRAKGAAPRSVTISAFWLAVDADELVALDAGVNATLSAEQWKKLSQHISARGQITCFDSQTVHLVAGTLRSAVTSFIPVVGQTENRHERLLAANDDTAVEDAQATLPEHVLGQIGGLNAGGAGAGNVIADNGSRVGYQPVTQTVNMGALLQVTPLLGDDAKSVAVDVHSIVIAPDKDIAPLDFHNGMKLDRISVTAQQFQTTLRMPVGQPTIVGGMTLQPTANDKDVQLFLMMEVAVQ